MSILYKEVVKLAQLIQKENAKGKKWIYFHDNTVDLIDILPNTYYQKTDILIVDDPTNYLIAINNRKPTQNELDQFTLINNISIIEEVEQEELYLPEELWEITIMNKPIKEILEMRTLSKEWKDRIDSLWCKLFERDYPNQIYNKKDCYNEYKKKYEESKILHISKNEIRNIIKNIVSNNVDINLDKVLHVLSRSFVDKNNILYFDPKNFFDQIYKIYIIYQRTMDAMLPITVGSMVVHPGEDEEWYQILNNIPIFKHFIIKKRRDRYGLSFLYDYQISKKRFIELFEKAYGKESFDKYFLEKVGKDLPRGKNEYGKTAKQLLASFRYQANK